MLTTRSRPNAEFPEHASAGHGASADRRNRAGVPVRERTVAGAIDYRDSTESPLVVELLIFFYSNLRRRTLSMRLDNALRRFLIALGLLMLMQGVNC